MLATLLLLLAKKLWHQLLPICLYLLCRTRRAFSVMESSSLENILSLKLRLRRLLTHQLRMDPDGWRLLFVTFFVFCSYLVFIRFYYVLSFCSWMKIVFSRVIGLRDV